MALIESIPTLLLAIGQVSWYMIQGLWNGIGAAFSGLFAGIGAVFKRWIIDPIKKLFGINSPSTMFADFGGFMIQGLINGLLNAGSAIWGAVKGIFTGLWDNIKKCFLRGCKFRWWNNRRNQGRPWSCRRWD